MNRKQLIKKYLEFFKSKGHKEIPNSSLIPENDPTVLFTTAGMHPLVPFLLGQKHPLGKRLCNVQRCIRTGDIEEVGDEVHHTFFEMMGNWSLGDYFKKEAIEFTFEFVTKILKIPVDKIAVTCFAGNKNSQKDIESEKIWLSLGIAKERIAFLGEEDNWWGPAGKTGPCGPSTEIFYWSSKEKTPKQFNPKDRNWVEIGNDVLMGYVKDKRLILVDGMYCLYDENFKLDKGLLKLINEFNTHYILVVNGFREKGRSIIKDYDSTKDTNWEAFSLEEEKIKKDNIEYFKILLKKFNLIPEEVIYFDHDKKNVETAKKLGILSKHYTDAKSIREFIEKNLIVFIPAKQKNIDFGGGVERTLAVLNNLSDNYQTDCFLPIIKEIEKLSGKKYSGNEREMRIIADHIKASVFIIADGVSPGNSEQGYVLRRLIRRAVRYGNLLGIKSFVSQVAEPAFKIYDDYDEIKNNKQKILNELKQEEERFEKCIEGGLCQTKNIFQNKKPIEKEKFTELMKDPNKAMLVGRIFELKRLGKNYSLKKPRLTKEEIDKATITGEDSFFLYQSFGFPLEMIDELAMEKRLLVSHDDFREELAKHQELSRTASAGKFKSGLADNSVATTKLHTAAHLLMAALRKVLKDGSVMQKGSNITPERLRMDFNFPRKLTDEEIKKVEDEVNKNIGKGIKVVREELSLDEARKQKATGVFEKKYGDIVSVYTIRDCSKEICTGPHVTNTSELGKFKILKEESSSAGVRRIKAVLED